MVAAKSRSDLILAGTFRPDRHAKRGDPPIVTGVPVRPKHLKGEARKLWDTAIMDLIASGAVAAVDTAILTTACEAWALYRAAADKAARQPTDGNCRRSVLAYYTMFAGAAAKCGLSPIDRQRLKLPPASDCEPHPISAFARSRKDGSG